MAEIDGIGDDNSLRLLVDALEMTEVGEGRADVEAVFTLEVPRFAFDTFDVDDDGTVERPKGYSVEAKGSVEEFPSGRARIQRYLSKKVQREFFLG